MAGDMTVQCKIRCQPRFFRYASFLESSNYIHTNQHTGSQGTPESDFRVHLVSRQREDWAISRFGSVCVRADNLMDSAVDRSLQTSCWVWDRERPNLALRVAISVWSIGCPTSSVAQANFTIKINFNILRSFSSSDILIIYLRAFLQLFHEYMHWKCEAMAAANLNGTSLPLQICSEPKHFSTNSLWLISWNEIKLFIIFLHWRSMCSVPYDLISPPTRSPLSWATRRESFYPSPVQNIARNSESPQAKSSSLFHYFKNNSVELWIMISLSENCSVNEGEN
jgi:hypothetical protein